MLRWAMGTTIGRVLTTSKDDGEAMPQFLVRDDFIEWLEQNNRFVPKEVRESDPDDVFLWGAMLIKNHKAGKLRDGVYYPLQGRAQVRVPGSKIDSALEAECMAATMTLVFDWDEWGLVPIKSRSGWARVPGRG